MARIWPDTLPLASEPGYKLTPVEQSVRTDMEVGARRLRRITAARRDSVEVQWTFTDVEMAAFRVWFGDEAWSLSGDSDNLTGWAMTGATINADALVGPDNVLADRIIEDGTTGNHLAQIGLGAAALASSTVLCRATIQSSGRSHVQVGLIDRAGVLHFAGVDLTSGAFESQSGLISRTIEDRGNGWWRVTITADCGVGAPQPSLLIAAGLDGTTYSYAGSGTVAVSVCEVNARVVTGYDLFVRTDASGNATGAAGGSAWVMVPLAFGGGLRLVEARFEAPWSAVVLPGLGWQVTARLEVRNA